MSIGDCLCLTVSFRVPIVALFHCILHISSTMIGATGWAEVTRHLDDSRSSWESAKGVLSTGGQLRWKQSGQKQNGWMEVTVTDESKDANDHKRLCHIYWVTSLSECKGSPVQKQDISVQSWGDTIQHVWVFQMEYGVQDLKVNLYWSVPWIREHRGQEGS